MPNGEVVAVACAFLWSLNAVLLRPVSLQLPALRITALQYSATALMMVALGAALGRSDAAAAIPVGQAAALVGAALIGMGGGDTLYVRALSTTGVALSYPVATGAYILLAFALAAFWLNEAVSLQATLGALVLLVGVWFIVRAAPGEAGAASTPLRTGFATGIAAAVLAGLGWAVTTTVMRAALVGVDVLAANMIRIPFVAIALLAFSGVRFRGATLTYQSRQAALVVVAGVVGLGLGSLAFLYAVQTAGAARTAALSSISPLFTGIMAVTFLGERLNFRLALGTGLTVFGAVLVV